MRDDVSNEFRQLWAPFGTDSIHRALPHGDGVTKQLINLGQAWAATDRRLLLNVQESGREVFSAHIDPEAARFLARRILELFPESST